MQPHIATILDSTEAVKWQGQVNRKVLNTSLTIGLVIAIGIGVALFFKETITYTQNGVEKQFSGSLAGIIVASLGSILTVLSYVSDRIKEYAITQKRIIIKSGIIGTDFKSINFDQIREAIIDVGLIGKIFGVGSIKIDTGKTETYSSGGNKNNRGAIRTRTMFDTLKHIDAPYETYKIIQGTLDNRKESLYSGRADREAHPEVYTNNQAGITQDQNSKL